MSKGGYKITDQGRMQCKRLLLWKEMWAAKNRTFDIDLLFVSPELQTQDSSPFYLNILRGWRYGSFFLFDLSKDRKGICLATKPSARTPQLRSCRPIEKLRWADQKEYFYFAVPDTTIT